MLTKRLLSTLVVGFIALAGLQSCIDGAEEPNTGQVNQDIAPPPPTNLTVTNLSNTFTPAQQLNWTAVPGATRYVLMRGTAGPGSETTYQSCCTGGPPFVANHLTAATNYCWQVIAANSIGQLSGRSNEVCLSTAGAVTIDPPANVTAQAISSTRINVSWDAVTNATSYNVYESVSGGAFNLATSVSAPATTVQRINLMPSTGYCYTVVTVAPGGQSVQSSPPACDTTFAQGLEGYWRLTETTGTTANDASGFARNLTLSGGAAFDQTQPQAPIDPPVGNNEPHLNIPAGTTSAASSAASISAFRLAQAFSITVWVRQVTAGDVRIMGMRNAGSCGSGQGWELAQTGGTLAFIGQNATLSFGTGLTVGDWTHLAVTYSGGAGGTLTAYINGVQVATTTYTAANAIAGALALGHYGGCSGSQIWLDEAQVFSRELSATEVATFGTRPAAPTALTITRVTSSAETMSWTPPASGADRWVILRGASSGMETHYTHAVNPPSTFNAAHLQPNTAYFWEVETVKNKLISLPSNEVTATTLSAPAAPTNVMATANSQTRITVSWDPVASATDYYVYFSTAQAGPYTFKGHVVAPTVSFQATGLTAGTTYWFEVQDKDSGQLMSPFSTPVSATTNP